MEDVRFCKLLEIIELKSIDTTSKKRFHTDYEENMNNIKCKIIAYGCDKRYIDLKSFMQHATMVANKKEDEFKCGTWNAT